ncbi:hypothetical protein RFI_30064 [Reticulomyxa filosa]|uniref:Uncharacterized protein n=1 Tax=Reticulomyxa filosa TaxID=46433 RepID=X6M0B7_RETFI|nr:hypothetical protein RFI_30064 [Reticulomyxa filosa]|eukprot:ETO07329.1 hypothetical protein RFI_30064 [Reticulomyxa filosa]
MGPQGQHRSAMGIIIFAKEKSAKANTLEKKKKKGDCRIFVTGAVYGCYGNWSTGGVSNGGFLCADNYEVCPSASRASSLGLVSGTCGSFENDKAFFATLESSKGDLNCNNDNGTGQDDIWGCANNPTPSPSYNCFSGCGPLVSYFSNQCGAQTGWC